MRAYRFIRDARPGDWVLHLTDNQAFTQVSRVAEPARNLDEPPDGREWSGVPLKVVPLEEAEVGVVETSLMMHLDPDRVEADRIPAPRRMLLPKYTVLPEPAGMVPESGVLASAEGLSAAIGASLTTLLVDSIGAILVKEFDGRG